MAIESSYNYPFVSLTGERLLCNGLSSTVISFPLRPLFNYRGRDIEFLFQHHFLAKSLAKERQFLIARNRTARESAATYDLTTMLHEGCNFRCTYCFEEFRSRALGRKELSTEEMAELQEFALRLGLRLHIPPLARLTFCKLQNKNALLIDTEARTQGLPIHCNRGGY